MPFIDAYNSAADHYDDAANSYWERFARRTLQHLAPPIGARLLDIGCGSGAFSIPAAEAVGPGGHVVGVDLAGELLALARRKAAARGLRNVTFEERDAFHVDEDRRFDGVVAIFSLFFAEDMAGAMHRLWTLVRPGGTLAVTTWGAMLFEPAVGLFWSTVAEMRPDLCPSTSPWERVNQPATLLSLVRSAGITDAEVFAERGQHTLNTAEDWWRIVLGSGFRATVEALSPAERERVHRVTIERLSRRRVRAVRTDTVYAFCRKPAAESRRPHMPRAAC